MTKLVTAIVLTAMLALPGATALAAEEAPASPPEQAAATEPAPEPAAANAQEEPAPAPSATPAQAPEDISGGNEYSEEAPPTAGGDTGTDTDTDTSTPEDTDTTPTQQAAPTTGTSTPSAVAADTTDSEATEGLPRTGSEGLIIALIGIALVGSGVLLRRAALHLN